jgi:hypothetical protein
MAADASNLNKSLDELTTALCDAYDSLVAPKQVYRNHNNKLFLALRAHARGLVGLYDAVAALRDRFNPLYCTDTDLYDAMKIVGADTVSGVGSLLRITIKNKHTTDAKTLAPGVYKYTSVLGDVFNFTLETEWYFEPQEERLVQAVSVEKGARPVSDNTVISVSREDGAEVSYTFGFSCSDNSGSLGYGDETPDELRQRILYDADRQDNIKEIQLKIRNLPSILECNVVFNDSTTKLTYDGVLMKPREILIVITGSPSPDIANIVCEDVVYNTTQVDLHNVVFYNNACYINERYPVYFMYHRFLDFSLRVTYRYEPNKVNTAQVENAINALYKKYKKMATHIDVFSEKDGYDTLAELSLPGVTIVDVNVYDSTNTAVGYVEIPKTRLANLTSVGYLALPVEGP